MSSMERGHVSLETAKRLKEVGFPQGGMVGWYEEHRHPHGTGNQWVLGLWIDYENYGVRDSFIAAPTADEIADEFPEHGVGVAFKTGTTEYAAQLQRGQGSGWSSVSESGHPSMAEALATLYIRLKTKRRRTFDIEVVQRRKNKP